MVIKAADLFSGVGGATQGIEMADVDVVLSVDSNETAVEYHNKNFESPCWNKDLSVLHDDIVDYCNRHNVQYLHGSPPCQTFSNVGNRELDESSNLVYKFLDYVTEISPTYVTIENVPNFANETDHNENKYSNVVQKRLKKLGYDVHIDVFDASKYGVPQSRKRAYIIASKERISLPETQDKVVMSDVVDCSGYEVQIPPSGTPQYIKAETEPRSVNELAHTQTATHRHWIVHNFEPSECGSITSQEYRKITIDESAMLQTFPKTFTWPSKKTDAQRLIGNAVPPQLQYHIVNSLI